MLVNWDEKYDTGIELIDEQHKALVEIINDLYLACTEDYEDTDAVFKETLKRMVDYVRFHFGAEQKLLEHIKYPKFTEHKKQHDTMVNDILEAAKEYNEGRRFVPNHFVRTLRDWVFSHIALSDQLYASYVNDQKKHGLLNNQQIALYLQG
jgi:hemerythrin